MFDAILAQSAAPIDLDTINQCTSSIFDVNSLALNCGAQLSEYVAQNWDIHWEEKIGNASPEFIATINISRYIAGPMVGLWVASGINRLWRNGFSDALFEFPLILMLVTLLYVNDGAIIRNTTLAARSLINHQNSLVLQLANNGEQFEAKLHEIADFSLVEQQVIDARSQCNGLTRNEDLLACMQAANVRAQDALDEYQSAHGSTPWFTRLSDYVTQTIGQVVQNPLAGPNPLMGIVVNPAISIILEGVMASLNGVIQNLVELSWLLTAVIVPIPVALSFYPGGRGALIAWAVSFLSLGLFKINLNLATAMVVSMLYARGPGDQLADMMLLSVGVVFMALGMTAGGGLAIFNGLSTAISVASLGLLNISTRAIGGG